MSPEKLTVDCKLFLLVCRLWVTTDLRLNEPRYASLPNIMKAKKKPIDMTTPSELGIDTPARCVTLKVEPPPKREAGILVESVDQLIDKLKDEAKVI